MLLLLAEDDRALCDGLTDVLVQASNEVVACDDGKRALQLLMERDFDLAIVDLGLPGLDGLDVVRCARRRQIGLPILIITARDSLSERINGLDAGADDYLIKPFEVPEFEARVRALLRRHRADRSDEICLGALRFTPGQPQIWLDGTLLELPVNELVLLELLARPGGRIISKDKIASRFARSGDAPSNTAIEISVHRLRRKLAPFGLRIRALRGFGYLLETQVDR